LRGGGGHHNHPSPPTGEKPAHRLQALLQQASQQMSREHRETVKPNVASIALAAGAAAAAASSPPKERRSLRESCAIAPQPRARRSPRDINARSELTAQWLHHLARANGARGAGLSPRRQLLISERPATASEAVRPNLSPRAQPTTDRPSTSAGDRPGSGQPQPRSARTYRDVRRDAARKSDAWMGGYSQTRSNVRADIAAAGHAKRQEIATFDGTTHSILADTGKAHELANYLTSLGSIYCQKESRRMEKLTG
jgi:hypothetical protein